MPSPIMVRIMPQLFREKKPRTQPSCKALMRMAAFCATRSRTNLALSRPSAEASRTSKMVVTREVEIRSTVSPLATSTVAAIFQNRAANKRRVETLDAGLFRFFMFQIHCVVPCAHCVSLPHRYAVRGVHGLVPIRTWLWRGCLELG